MMMRRRRRNLIEMFLPQTTKANPQNWTLWGLIIRALRTSVEARKGMKRIPKGKELIEKDVDMKERLKVVFSFLVFLACSPSGFEREPQEPGKREVENSSLREGYRCDCRAFLVDPCHQRIPCDAVQEVVAI